MSLFSDYQAAINSLAEERRHKDQIGYQNYLQSEANRQGGLRAIANAAIGAGLMYAFPPAGMAAGKAALLGGGLSFMGGGNAMALPYMMNRGGTPKPTVDTPTPISGVGYVEPPSLNSLPPVTPTSNYLPLNSWNNTPSGWNPYYDLNGLPLPMTTRMGLRRK